MFRPAAVLVCVLLLANQSIFFKVNALPFHGIEENCILSFVVPKEKMKSSCELDEKVNRRINAMETKVNLYRQQMSDLQTQLDKQRLLNSDKLTRLEQQVKDINVNMDTRFLIEQRLTLVEKEFQQLHSEVSSRLASGKAKPGVLDDKTVSLMFNTVDSNSVTLSNIAKSMIELEVNALHDSLTKRLESYVREQMLLNNKVLHMLQKRTEVTERRGQATNSPEQAFSETTTAKQNHDEADPEVAVASVQSEKPIPTEKHNDHIDNHTEEHADKHTDEHIDERADLVFDNDTNEFFNVNATHHNVGDSEENVTVTWETDNINDEDLNVTQELNGTAVEEVIYTQGRPGTNETTWNSSTIVSIGGLFGNNDSFVGDTSEINTTLETHSVIQVDNDISRGATSRMNSQPVVATDRWDRDNMDSDKHDNNGSERDKHGTEDMVRDQQKQPDSADKIKDEITAFLLHPLAEVMSTIEKQKISLEEKIKLQDEKCEQRNKDVSIQVKELNGNFQAVTLQIESLSNGFQDSFSKLDKIKSLETLLYEVKKNITSEPLTVSAIEVEEQSKKLKKLERLVGVYQQSLDRYRNETKQENREVRDSLEKEANAMKVMMKTLQSDVTTTLSSEISRQNNTIMNRIQEITDLFRQYDENLIVLQLDMSNAMKTLSNMASRADRDMEKVQQELNQLAERQRNFRKRLEHLDQSQGSLAHDLNTTVNEVASLKMDVRLSLDEWIPYKFEFDPSRTECFGDQYVKRTKYSKARFVGVVLCTSKRYKIFLSTSLQSKFLNIGDSNGMGHDHCEFVGGTGSSLVTLSEHKSTYEAVQGFSRNDWGDKPILSHLNSIRPTARWYECGVDIP
ncbi:hypothetical protein BsWGS_19306 [Bradybaena similaris]